MTRKFFISLLSLACALCLVACEDALGSGETDAHQHNWSSYYMMDGEKYYQTCAGCDEKKYADREYDEKDLVVGIYIKSTDGFTYFWTNGSWSVEDFDNSSDVSNVIIKEEYRGKPVTSIGWGAFLDCSNLKSVMIPNSVTSIDWCAFEYCSSLTDITIPNSVTSIGGEVFRGCRSLTSVTIPDSVISIESGTFINCSSLKSVTIPNNVTSIERGAFDGCSSLAMVNYRGSEAQWNEISIGENNCSIQNATINYNYTK